MDGMRAIFTILGYFNTVASLTVREVAPFTRFDGDAVRKRLEGLVRDGEITVTMQGKKTVYSVIHEEEIEQV
jgi:hypothetical protein